MEFCNFCNPPIWTIFGLKLLNWLGSFSFKNISVETRPSALTFLQLAMSLLSNIYQQNSTSILMQMLQSDWLSYPYTISHQRAVAAGRPRNTKFLQFFRSFGRNFRCKRVIRFLRRLKEGHLRFLDFKNLKILKERVRA